ncbi:MAG: ABC transporter, partial [Robiginitalea sp.]|nr:ABC transporter [Robiginitalea sp.]
MKELKHLNKYFKKYGFKLLLGILITIIARVFQLVMPSYVKNIIETVEKYLSAELTETVARQQL